MRNPHTKGKHDMAAHAKAEFIAHNNFPEKDRSRHDRRKKDVRKAIRKKKIAEKIYGYEWYDNLNEYSKGKVHCSCAMCSGASKTNTKALRTKGHGKRPGSSSIGTTNHRNGKNWTVADLKKIERMKEE